MEKTEKNQIYDNFDKMGRYQSILRKNLEGIILLSALFCVYAIVGSYGYGNDCDTYALIRTGQKLMSSGIYEPSRPPGLFLPDIIIGVSSYVGGSGLSNRLSSIAAVLSLYLFYQLAKNKFGGTTPLLMTAIIGLNPYFIIAASSSIDYIYSIFFGICGLALLSSNLPLLSSILFGCAVSSRVGNCLIIALIYLYFLYATWKDKDIRTLRRIILSACLAVLVTILFFIPIYWGDGKTFGFFTYYIEEWSYTDHLARFIYKNVYLFGLVTCLLFSAHTITSAIRKKLFLSLEMAFAIAIVAAHELLFMKIPLEISYLLPLLFVIVPLWALALKPGNIIMLLLLMATIGYGFFGKLDILDVHYNKAGNVAIAADIGLSLRPGIVTSDIQKRPASERFFFQEYRLGPSH